MSKLKDLELLLSKGRITRREFVVRVSALGLMLGVSPTLLSSPAYAATPQRGGRLRIGIDGGSTTDTLDPAPSASTMSSVICQGQLYNSLVEIDAKGNAIPELAESWEASHNAAIWTFKLRKGVEFHNGKSMDAEDVIFSLNYHRGEESKSGAKGIVKPIKEIVADGKYTVKFILNEGNADFPFLMSDYHLCIVPVGTTDFSKGIGIGGYVLSTFEPGVRALTKRNPNYWKKGRAHFDEVETLNIDDINARVTALKTNQIDYMARVDTKIAHLLKKTPNIQLINVTGTYHNSIPMLTDVSPYDNNDVRLALKYAIDREALVKTVLRGFGTIGNDHPIGPNQKYFASDLPQRKYDPDKARYHMKKAGLMEHTFNLHAADGVFVGAMDTAVLYQEHAAKAGIKINVVREPNDGYWKSVWRKKPWCMCYWGGRPTADWMFSSVYAEGVAWNDTHWKHDRFNKILKEARSELNESKRREMYAEMQRLVKDEGGVVIPMLPNILEAATTKLKHGDIATNWTLDGFRVAERWWFNS